MATEFEPQVLLEISKDDYAIVGVIQWIVDGDPKRPALAKYQLNKDGRIGKAKGLSLIDIEKIEPRLEEIKELLKAAQTT